jgi:integrase
MSLPPALNQDRAEFLALPRSNPSQPPPGQAAAAHRPHDLRHLHATTLPLAGVLVHVVAARLGHADPAVPLRVYSHVLREHAAGVDDIFAQAIKVTVSESV